MNPGVKKNNGSSHHNNIPLKIKMKKKENRSNPKPLNKRIERKQLNGRKVARSRKNPKIVSNKTCTLAHGHRCIA